MRYTRISKPTSIASMCAHILINRSDFLVSKESAGAIDEEDFIKAFTDVPTVQVHKHRTHTHIRLTWSKASKQSKWDFLRPPPIPSLLYRSTHRGILRTTSTRSARFAPTTNTTGTREPMLSVAPPLPCAVSLSAQRGCL